MPDSVYKIIELVGTSEASWEDAAKMDMKIEDGKVVGYRARVTVSFKYET